MFFDFLVSLNVFKNVFTNSILTYIHSSIPGLRFKKGKWMKMLCYVFLMSSITALCLTRSPKLDCRIEAQTLMLYKILFSRTKPNKLAETEQPTFKFLKCRMRKRCRVEALVRHYLLLYYFYFHHSQHILKGKKRI